MAQKTIYCVQAYGGGKREFVRGMLREFKTADGALGEGEALARRVPGVVVFKVTGEPDFDAWGEPEIMATHGRVPSAIAAR